MTTLSPSLIPSPLQWHHLALAGGCAFSLGILAGGLWNLKRPSTITSPRATLLPSLSSKEIAELPYPPDVLPGARDVDTPYGTIRVYEFGPEDGRRVLFVHGISTPAISLGGVAHALVEQAGCRVMLFDLFGRGYSDTPGDLPHDIRLFTTQMMLAMASSPISWKTFSLVGYSLGGGIGATFTSYFPEMIESLILFAPAGLLRPYHISRTSVLLYSEGILPEGVLQRFVRRRLRSPMVAPLKPAGEGTKPADAAAAAVAGEAKVNLESNSRAVLSKSRPDVTVENCVLWQLDQYPAFVAAFMSTIRYGPVRDQHDRWRMIGERLTRQNVTAEKKQNVLIVLGENDPIIIKDEVIEDATNVLQGNVEFMTLANSGHEVPITRSEEIVKGIVKFWAKTT